MSADDLLDRMMALVAAGHAAGEWESGCDQCPADVELIRTTEHSQILHVGIMHEPWCRELARRENRVRTRQQRREAKRHGCP